MLVNPLFLYDPQYMSVLSLIGQGGMPKCLEEGIFLSNSFSMGNIIVNEKKEYFYFELEGEYIYSYGVCDNLEQLKNRYNTWLQDPDMKFCISLTKVTKDTQPSSGGWRWHKWGEYIGDKKPKHEYLYDEDETIQEVYCYHIYQLLD